MPKTKSFNFTLGTLVTREFIGRAIYWGSTDDHVGTGTGVRRNQTLTTYAGGVKIQLDGRDRDNSNTDFYMSRAIFKFDLNSLPANANITSATLTITLASAAWANTSFLPVTLGVYRVFPVPDMTDANLQYYDSSATLAWNRFGMVDGIDYKALAEATNVITAPEVPGVGVSSAGINAATGDISVPKSFDLTNLVKYVMNTVSRACIVVVGRTDEHRRTYGTMFNNIIFDIGGTYTSELSIWADAGRHPQLVVNYIDALTFHPSHDDGTIDTSIIIDTTDSGIYQFDALRVGGVGIAKKFWVKNNTASSAVNLNVYSQRSYGSKIGEMQRTTVGNGTISDITTVDKSVNQVNYTHTEQWRITFTSATAFTVEHDNGTFDDPTLTDAWTAAVPGTGGVGTVYTNTTLGVSFLMTAGGTPFTAGDRFIFRTFEDDAHPGAPADSDIYLHIAHDSSNAPSTFQPMPWKPTLVTNNVVSDTVVPVADVSLFMSGMQVIFTSRSTNTTLGTRTVVTVGASTITVNTNITLTSLDYVEAIRIGTSPIDALGTFPFWVQTAAPLNATREVKWPRWRATAE